MSNDSQMPKQAYQTEILDSLALYDVIIIFGHTCHVEILGQQVS